MELKDWELRELEKIRQARKDFETLYFESVKKSEKEEYLQNMKDSGENPERVKIIEELFNHRHVSRERNVKSIDYAIRGWVNIRFLAEMSGGIFAKKKIPKKVDEIMEDLGRAVCEKYGELGMEIWKKEAFNIALVYIHLCRTDKTYGSVLFGIGHMRKDKLERKICYDVVNNTHTIPKELGITQFEDFKEAAIKAFKFAFPNSGNLIELMIEQADGEDIEFDDEL